MNRQARQALYDRIRESSQDEVILEEMTRLGFWPPKDSDAAASQVPEDMLKRQGELQKRLRELTRQHHQLRDPEAALKLMRTERMKQAREQRQETKRKNAEAAHQKAKSWWQRRQTQILHIGDGYSAGLNATDNKTDRLNNSGLPTLEDANALAVAMGIPLSELRFLAHARRTSQVNHYQDFAVPKKTGGQRLISAPKPRLKRAQYWVLTNILEPLATSDQAHGFVKGRSIVSNAKPHVGAKVVINADLENFFPSIGYPRIKGLFVAFGYSEQIATLLALLCTRQDCEQITLDGQAWYVGNGQRALPQGAPTSPALTNLLCRKLDARLNGMAQKLGWAYTRYADDLTFSTRQQDTKPTQLLWRLKGIVSSEGFVLHPKKTRIMRAGQQQEVTGIVVNDKPSLDRATVRRARAAVHQASTNGLQQLSWNGQQGPAALEALRGWVNYLAMVDAERAAPMQAKLKALQKAEHTSSVAKISKADFQAHAAAGNAPWADWWQPTEPAEPELPKLLQEPPPEDAPQPRRTGRNGDAQTDESAGHNPWYESEQEEQAGPIRRFFSNLFAVVRFVVWWLAFVWLLKWLFD